MSDVREFTSWDFREYNGENVNVILEYGNFNFMLKHNISHKQTDIPVES